MSTRFRTWLSHTVRFIARQEAWVLVAALVIVGTGWAFVELADEVVEGDAQRFDMRVIDMLRTDSIPPQPVGPPCLLTMELDITALGSVTVLTGAIIATLGYLLMRRMYLGMFLVLAATIGGELLSATLKWLFDRPRPDAQWRVVDAMTASFPSGHAMLGAIVYLTLGALLARLEPRRPMKAYIIGASMLLAMLIGLSRVYLGVHYATDVLAGWCAGLAWALTCWLVARWLQQRGRIESASSPQPGTST